MKPWSSIGVGGEVLGDIPSLVASNHNSKYMRETYLQMVGEKNKELNPTSAGIYMI